MPLSSTRFSFSGDIDLEEVFDKIRSLTTDIAYETASVEVYVNPLGYADEQQARQEKYESANAVSTALQTGARIAGGSKF